MFSIDHLFEEAIYFIRRFLKTFFLLIFRPVKTFRDIYMLEKDLEVRPSMYLSTSILFFFSFQFVDTGLPGSPFIDLFKGYEKNISEYTLPDRILYVFPIVGAVYILVYVISKVLIVDKNKQQPFIKFCFYWIGSNCLLQIITISIINLFIFYSSLGPYSFSSKHRELFIWVQILTYLTRLLLAFSLTLIAITSNIVNNIRRLISYLSIPFIIAFSIPTINYLTITVVSLFHLNDQKILSIESLSPLNSLPIEVDTINDKSYNLLLKTDAILKNGTESSYYISSSTTINVSDTITIHSNQEKTPQKKEFFFKISSWNGFKLQGGTILKPKDEIAISLESVVNQSILNKIMPFTGNKYFRAGTLNIEYTFINVSDKKGIMQSQSNNIKAVLYNKPALDSLLIRLTNKTFFRK